jgi:hypothetical protein
MAITVPEGIVRPEVQLVGEDGNAFSILGRVSKALKRAGNDESVVDAYMEQAMAGDYDHLLSVTMAFIEHGHDYDLDDGEVNDAYDDEDEDWSC